MAVSLSRWTWEMRRLADRAGWPAVAAAVLVLAAATGWTAMSMSTRSQADALRADDEIALARLARSHDAATSGAPGLSSDLQLARFEQGLPARQSLAASYATLWTLARRHGVLLRQAEFKLSEGGPDDAFSRCTITVPFKADYAALRGFVDDALRALPGLALQDMNLRRDDAKSLQLDATLRLVLFVQRGV